MFHRGDTRQHVEQLVGLALAVGITFVVGLLPQLGLVVAARTRPGVHRVGQSAPPRTDFSGAAQDEKDMRALEPGKPIERELAGGENHSYQLTLASGQYLHVVVDQRGIDVVVTLFGPGGQKLIEVDSPHGAQGPETVSAVGEAAGAYRLEVRTLEKGAAAGRYAVKITELRTATVEDRSRVAAQSVAQKALAEGEQLRAKNTAESLRMAIEKYEEALPLRREVGDRRGEADTLHYIGSVYDDSGENQKALDYYNRALPLRRAVGDRWGEANTLNNIGKVYESLGENQKALDHYNRALPLRREGGDRPGEAVTLHNIGVVYASLGENQKALDYYNRALSLRRAVGDRRGEANTLNNIGVVYDSLGENQKALDYFNQVLPLRREVGDRRGEARTLHNIGKVYASLGENQKALDYYNRALPLRRAVSDRSGEAGTLYAIARVERDRGDLLAARTLAEAALTIIESLRTKVASQQLRASYFATVQKGFEFHIDLLMRLHNQRPSEGFDMAALQTSERARARSLLELLSEARADIREGVNPALLERERSLQQQLNTKAQHQMQLLSGPHSEAQAVAAVKELAALTTELQGVEGQIRATSPRYAALTQPQPLSLKEIQTDLLDSNTLLLEYALGEERSYLWSVTPTSINSHELPRRAEIEMAARRVYELLTAPNRPEKNETSGQRRARLAQAEAAYLEAAATLSQLLLGPVAQQLETKRLLIVSEGALQYVPFAALPLPVAADAGQGIGVRDKANRPLAPNAQPLIVEHEIISLPSASALSVLRREPTGRRPAAKLVAVLADPVFDKDDSRVGAGPKGQRQGSGIRGDGKAVSVAVSSSLPSTDFERAVREVGLADDGPSIPRLPFSRREAEMILALAPQGEGMKALDFNASRAMATSAELSQYRFVHFATHGLLNSEHPELSGVVFSLVDKRGAPQDGFLRLHEVYNLKLPAELVVLSACQTGLGKEVKGEGLVGLTRGFMYAGAPRVVASLWKVDDVATAELMGRFYRGMLRERLRPAAALRAAQVEMWKQRRWQAPYYWAAFGLQGEWR